MSRFLLSRARHAALVVFIVSTLVFALARAAPGDPFLAGAEATMSSADRAQLRAQWGYDLPVWRQYLRWVRNFATGDFGWSHSRERPVTAVLREALPNTLLLTGPGISLGLMAGIALGTWQAARRRRTFARAADAATLVVVSIPDFIIAVGVLTILAVRWRLAPLGGIIDPARHDSLSTFGRMADVGAHIALPGLTLALLVGAVIARHHAAAVELALDEGYVRAARAAGVGEGRRLWRHVLRNTLGPVIAVGGVLLPAVAGGVVLIEKVFGWPGMGLVLVDAVTGRDYALVQATAVVGTVFVVAAGALADVLAALADPRVVVAA